MEHLAIEGDIDTDVDVLPVPVVTDVILGQTLSFDQFTCKNSYDLFMTCMACMYVCMHFIWQNPFKIQIIVVKSIKKTGISGFYKG